MSDIFQRLQDLATRADEHRKQIEAASAKLNAEADRIEIDLLCADMLSLLNEIRTHRHSDSNRMRIAALRDRLLKRAAA